MLILAKDGVDSVEAAAGDARAVGWHVIKTSTGSSSVTPAALSAAKTGHAAEGMRLIASLVAL